MAKLIKITSFLSQVWNDGSPTAEVTKRETYINPDFIISITDTKQKACRLIVEQIGCKIVIKKGMIAEELTHNETAEIFIKKHKL